MAWPAWNGSRIDPLTGRWAGIGTTGSPRSFQFKSGGGERSELSGLESCNAGAGKKHLSEIGLSNNISL